MYEAYQALVPPIEVMFDNVQETPPALPYVICLISYLDVTTPVICQGESMVEQINGNLQLSVSTRHAWARDELHLELYATGWYQGHGHDVRRERPTFEGEVRRGSTGLRAFAKW